MDIILQFIFYSLLVSSAGLSCVLVEADDSTALAGNGTCVSVVLHEFYNNASRQARFSNTPCNSKNESAGVFWLEKSTNISAEQLITPHLRIGVPNKTGFLEFMKVDHVNSDGSITPIGFPIEVFEAAIATLPYNITYKYFAFQEDPHAPDYYNHLVSHVHDKEYDAIVGDTTIRADRSDLFEFTYPYMDGGVRLIVPTKSSDVISPWWFMKPLTTDLWLTTLAFSVLKAGLPSVLVEADDSTALAGNGTCVSVVLHEFYNNASLIRFSNTPCNSRNESAGVFWLEKSTNISAEQLIIPHLRIGVPNKTGFLEFTKMDRVNSDGSTTPTGFPIDVFEAAIATLPYKVTYEYFAFQEDPLDPEYYNHLISQVHDKEYDAVVGDTTIRADRSDLFEFTYPYMDGGVRLIVPTKSSDVIGPWWFMKPLTMDLWLTTLAFVVLKGFLVWFFESKTNPEFQGPPTKVFGKIVSFSVSTFVFAHHERLESNYSRFIVNLWILLVFILVTAFAANLTSMLTVDKIQPTITDLEALKENGDYIGYHVGSFVFHLLQNEGINASKLKPYSTVKEYAEGLKLGSRNGGVSVIMDEIPYIRVFLKDHCREYTMVGRTYKTGGFGFVFPRGSAMVLDISRAVMKFTQGDEMYGFEKKWFADETTCHDAESPISNQSLPLYSLRSIYIMVGLASIIALFFYYFHHIYSRRKNTAPANDSTAKLLRPQAATELITYNGVPANEHSVRINDNRPQNGNDHDPTAGEKEDRNDLSVDSLRCPKKKRKSSSF